MSGPDLFGSDLFGRPIERSSSPLAQRFVMPPFSVLDARSGLWQQRKRAWLDLGIKSEVGRPKNLLHMSEQSTTPGFYYAKNQAEKLTAQGLPRKLS
jgi:hypothetical protein